MKKITRVIVILFMLIVSMEADMAKTNIKSDVNVPAYLRGGGGNKGGDVVAQRPDNYKPNMPLAPRVNPKSNNDVMDAPQGPTWSDYLMGVNNALTIASQIGAGAVSAPNLAGNIVGNIAGNIAGDIQDGIDKGNADQLANKANKDKNKLVNRMLAARSDTLRGGRTDTLRNGGAGGGGGGGYGFGGFGSRYGGNWGGGGGGGGYGGYSNDPAWMNYLLNLYSWNIK